MKQFLFLFIVLCLFSCTPDHKTPSEQEKELSYDWLVGKWKRLDDKAGNETYEYWTKTAAQKYHGHGFVLQRSDTVWQEQMIFDKRDSNWVFIVQTPGNNNQVEFILSTSDATSFVVDNPKHDFPKRIKYWTTNKQLFATIEDDSTQVKFQFEPIEK